TSWIITTASLTRSARTPSSWRSCTWIRRGWWPLLEASSGAPGLRSSGAPWQQRDSRSGTHSSGAPELRSPGAPEPTAPKLFPPQHSLQHDNPVIERLHTDDRFLIVDDERRGAGHA